MVQSLAEVLKGNKIQRRYIAHLEEEIDMLHSSIKLYFAQIQRNQLGEADSRRWAEIIDTALNL